MMLSKIGIAASEYCSRYFHARHSSVLRLTKYPQGSLCFFTRVSQLFIWQIIHHEVKRREVNWTFTVFCISPFDTSLPTCLPYLKKRSRETVRLSSIQSSLSFFGITEDTHRKQTCCLTDWRTALLPCAALSRTGIPSKINFTDPWDSAQHQIDTNQLAYKFRIVGCGCSWLICRDKLVLVDGFLNFPRIRYDRMCI